MKEVTHDFFKNYLIDKRNEILSVSANFDFEVAKKNMIANSSSIFYLQGVGVIKFVVKFVSNCEKVFYLTHTTFDGFGLNENTENEYFIKYAKEFLFDLSSTTGLKIELIN